MGSNTSIKSIEISPAIVSSITTGSFGQTNVDAKWTPVMQADDWTWLVLRHESSVPGDIFISTQDGARRNAAMVIPRGASLPGFMVAPGTEIFAFSSIEPRLLQVIATKISLQDIFGQLGNVLADAICRRR